MNHRHVRRSVFVPFLAIVLLLLTASIAAAHEHRHVGDYTLVVGFRSEPAYVGMLNGLDLRVEDHDGEPVEGLAGALTVHILYGGQAQELNVREDWGQPGAYTADVVPTETGTYSFQITGAIEGEAFDEVFTGGPDTFSEVEATSALEFPAGNAAEEDDDADTAMLFGIGGLIAGLLGLGAGLAGYTAARQARDTSGQRSSPMEVETA